MTKVLLAEVKGYRPPASLSLGRSLQVTGCPVPEVLVQLCFHSVRFGQAHAFPGSGPIWRLNYEATWKTGMPSIDCRPSLCRPVLGARAREQAAAANLQLEWLRHPGRTPGCERSRLRRQIRAGPESRSGAAWRAGCADPRAGCASPRVSFTSSGTAAGSAGRQRSRSGSRPTVAARSRPQADTCSAAGPDAAAPTAGSAIRAGAERSIDRASRKDFERSAKHH